MKGKPELLSSSCQPVLLLLEAALLVLVMEPLLVLLHGVGGVVLLVMQIEGVFFLAW